MFCIKEEWNFYLPNTHITQSIHDVVLHGGIIRIVKNLSKGRNDFLGLFLILETHFTKADNGQRLEFITWHKLDARGLACLVTKFNKRLTISCIKTRQFKDLYKRVGLILVSIIDTGSSVFSVPSIFDRGTLRDHNLKCVCVSQKTYRDN